MTCRQEKNDTGKKLCKPNQSQIERTMGDFVDLPADGDGFHFEREHDETTRSLKKHEGRIAECSARIIFRVCNFRLYCGHLRLTRRTEPRCFLPGRHAQDTSGPRLVSAQENQFLVLHSSTLV